MTHPCLVVLTARGPQRLLDEGGTQAWRLNKANAAKMRYCVCVQNRHGGHWGGADQEHHHAFLIGEISAVEVSPERADRFIVEFSRYSRLDYPNAWPGLRNPVRYGTLEEFGIPDPDSLNWYDMPPKAVASIRAEAKLEDEDGFGPLTIPEAKAGLALGLGVPESSIEIVVRF